MEGELSFFPLPNELSPPREQETSAESLANLSQAFLL